jgi:uncharacterized protein
MDHLLTLFRIDGQLRGLKSRLDTAKRYDSAQQKQLDQLKTQRQDLDRLRKQIQAGLGSLEVEAAALDERMAKLRDELNGAQTNKQYTALLTELNTLKASRTELDKRMLAEMERLEQMKVDAASLDASLVERERVRELAAAQLRERQGEIGQSLDELQQQRDSAAGAVPTKELEKFNWLADMYEGEAMAPVLEIDRRHREYACGACNMHLPFETVSQLTSSGQRVVQCTACQRILYMQEETRGSLVKK